MLSPVVSPAKWVDHVSEVLHRAAAHDVLQQHGMDCGVLVTRQASAVMIVVAAPAWHGDCIKSMFKDHCIIHEHPEL